MKTIKYLAALLLALPVMVSCYEDKGNYDYKDVSDIEIGGIESNYSRIALLEYLEIEPQIESSYSESELEYTWLLYELDDNLDNRFDTIGREKNLKYLVKESVGTYRVWLYVKNKTTGFYRHARTDLNVVTQYSRGHYILKETAEGRTDMDMMLDDGGMMEDIIAKTQGESLQGTPRSMGIIYQCQMVDPGTNSKSRSHSIGVITYDKKVNVFRAADMYLAFDHSTLFYDEPDDTPYMFSTSGSNGYEYLSSNGMYWNDFRSDGSGILGLPAGISGGSDHWAYIYTAIGHIYWDEAGKRFLRSNERGAISEIFQDGETFPKADCDCLFVGAQWNKAYVVLKNNSEGGKLNIHEITWSSASATPTVSKPIKDNEIPATMAGATRFATNEIDLQMLYYENGGKFYCYNMGTKTAQEMTFQDLPSDETVTYFANRIYNMGSGYKFNNLVVATHKDGKYNIYMYEMLGGLPYGKPVKTASGTGKVKEMDYLGTYFSDFDSTMVAYGWSKSLYTR